MKFSAALERFQHRFFDTVLEWVAQSNPLTRFPAIDLRDVEVGYRQGGGS